MYCGGLISFYVLLIFRKSYPQFGEDIGNTIMRRRQRNLTESDVRDSTVRFSQSLRQVPSGVGSRNLVSTGGKKQLAHVVSVAFH